MDTNWKKIRQNGEKSAQKVRKYYFVESPFSLEEGQVMPLLLNEHNLNENPSKRRKKYAKSSQIVLFQSPFSLEEGARYTIIIKWI